AAHGSADATSNRRRQAGSNGAKTCANSSTNGPPPAQPAGLYCASQSAVRESPLPHRIDALICPRWTIRMEGAAAVEEDLVAAVNHGRIVALLPRAEAESRFAPDVRHERPEHVLLPGLVNAHTHAGMSLMRGFADDMPLERWLEERIWPAEGRLVNAEFVADGTRLAIAEMLLGGTTCFADMYYFPDVVGETAVECGIRAVVGMIAVDFPTPWASTPEEYFSKGLAVHDRFKSEPLITTAFAPH